MNPPRPEAERGEAVRDLPRERGTARVEAARSAFGLLQPDGRKGQGRV